MIFVLYTFRYTLSIDFVHKSIRIYLYIFMYTLLLTSRILFSTIIVLREVDDTPISYERLFELMERKGVKKIDLRKAGISPTIVDRLVKGTDVNTSTIRRLCEILDCQPGDIMEYEPDQPLD